MRYLSKKYFATVHSTVCPFSSCSGKLCICAGFLVTLQTRYFRLMVPQWVISIFKHLISLVNLTLCESVNGFLCSLMSRISKTSHIKSMTGWACKLNKKSKSWSSFKTKLGISSSYLVKSCGRDVNIEHHFPLWRPHTLMETKPYFTTSSQRMVIAIRARKETSAHRSISHGGQMSHHNIQSLNSIKWNGPCSS